jgi:exonuclease V gamma subunit|tara:strand:- start:2261 stop:2500 length:240 start_codon:yes stop_codon:yes gene_type:complete
MLDLIHYANSQDIKDRQFFAMYIKRLGLLTKKWYLAEHDKERKEKLFTAMKQCADMLKDYQVYQGEYIEQEVGIDELPL